ncbi:hypothetical protein CYLTODRAFT_418578 [Cylindrobasidium torrendii FP15055 ss-10]|uniref:VWFA domain-containing protein n=1 Tax=Cylindrobasidium torrendii FP15055 ss-10 TaxID=1314674 RepID=A0A0D7BQ15_9AGAR|nr:hypothetical protein CYLTODRAFT_418578 [Cylindrobasidium torrendii FP15055 ss-10]
MDQDADMDFGGPAQVFGGQEDTRAPDTNRRLLDLVFVQDCTGSQGSYITSATKNIREICAHIYESGRLQEQGDLRVGLVAFRDHPPQDHTYVTRNFGFTSDVGKVHEQLSGLYASGGGDGPEAVTAALVDALNMDWRQDAARMVVLIADAPPHGIGEFGDGFDEGSPDGFDPLQVARQFANRGITLFFVACEPALSGYLYATDFYKAITTITSGLMLPLTTADLLAHAIVGSVLENLDMERLVLEVGQAVAERVQGNHQSVDDVARELHERLLLRNESTKKVVIESIYRETPESASNVEAFCNADTLKQARPFLQKVSGSRFTEKYAQMRQRGYTPYSHTYVPATPPRSPTLSRSLSPRATPSSPPRKVVQDFASYGVASGTSVFGTSVAPSPFSLAGGKAAFGSIRNTKPRGGGFDDDDDDDDDDNFGPGKQRVQLKDGSVTLEQARRIAIQSVMRNGGGM